MSTSIKTPDENPSNVESILSDTIGLPGYTINPPGSRIETLLIELNELIKGGGGGGSGAYATDLSLTIDSSTYVITAVLKNQNGESIGTPQTIDLPMESVVVSGSYNSQTKKVVLTLQNGSTVEFSVADLIDGLQSEITSVNKLDADLVDDSTSTNKFVTNGEKSTWNSKQNALSSAQLDAVNSGIDATKVTQIATNEINISSILDGANIDSFGDVEVELATKANASTTYTKTEVDTALGSKQNTISDLSTIRSGAALGATAVQPETGKGLSTNDFTTTEKTKLAGIEAGANKTTVDDALSSSSTNPVQNKVVKTALDSKANASTTYTKTEVDTALSGKQNAIDSSHELSADLVDDTSTTNKFATAAELEQIETNKNNISTDEAALVELVDSGAKNVFIVGFTSKAAKSSAPSCTNNGDGTVTLNGSRVGDDSIMVFDLSLDLPASTYTRYTLPAGKYVVSGSTNSNARIQVYCHDGTNLQALATSMNSSVEFNYNSDLKATYPYIVWRLLVKSSSSFDNVKLYPMICTKAAWDISQTYQPYRPSYQELYERVVALEQANQ